MTEAPNGRIRTASVTGLAFALALGSLALNGAQAADPPTRPNIILILADDVGCEPLGCYGGTSYATPHLDKLAETGMRFNHCYSMPVCHPTRVCLMTGRYPFRLKHPKWGSFPKAEEQRTIATVMKRAGYVTAVAGKWQLALLGKDLQQPHRMGFDLYSLFGWHEGPRYYQPLIWQNGNRREDVRDRYGPDVYTDVLIEFMKQNRDRPFFAFYSMALCHDVTDDLQAPVPYAPGKDRYDNYQEMIEAMDVQVGNVIRALDQLDLRNNTLVLFTGDNGTAKSSIIRAENGKYVRDPVYCEIGGESVRGGKGNLTNDGTNVPLIANWAGVIEPGQVVNDLVDMSDFLPTCAELGKAPLPNGIAVDGESFAARLRGTSDGGRDWVYAERGNQSWWVRTLQFKLYNNGQLYNLKNDPQEKKPILSVRDNLSTAMIRTKLQTVLDQLKHNH